MGLTRRDGLVALATLGVGPAAALPGRLALNGFDAVSYFLPGGPVAGLPGFTLSWSSRAWRFAQAANRAAFARDPGTYAPRLGGYDAAGVMDGRLVDADPLIFAVIADRLYLFRDAARRERVLAEPGSADRAEALWPALARLTDGEPG